MVDIIFYHAYKVRAIVFIILLKKKNIMIILFISIKIL